MTHTNDDPYLCHRIVPQDLNELNYSSSGNIYQHVTCNNLHPITFVVLCVTDMEPINPHGFLLPLLLFYFFVLYNLQVCFWVCSRPMRDGLTLLPHLSLAGCRPRISPDLARVLCNWSGEETEMCITALCSIPGVKFILVGCDFAQKLCKQEAIKDFFIFFICIPWT